MIEEVIHHKCISRKMLRLELGGGGGGRRGRAKRTIMDAVMEVGERDKKSLVRRRSVDGCGGYGHANQCAE